MVDKEGRSPPGCLGSAGECRSFRETARRGAREAGAGIAALEGIAIHGAVVCRASLREASSIFGVLLGDIVLAGLVPVVGVQRAVALGEASTNFKCSSGSTEREDSGGDEGFLENHFVVIG